MYSKLMATNTTPTSNNGSGSASTTDTASNSAATISMHEFLDFLKITCQVNESMDSNSEKTIDYNDLAKNELVNMLLKKSSFTSNQTTPKPSPDSSGMSSAGSTASAVEALRKEKAEKAKRLMSRKSKDGSDNCGYRSNLDPALIDKLDEVINEGILDSVLPFICAPPLNTNHQPTGHVCPAKLKSTLSTVTLPSAAQPSSSGANLKPTSENVARPNAESTSPSSTLNNKKTSDNSLITSTLSRDKVNRRKSIQSVNPTTGESDVVIHVCDEVKGVSRDFMCQQKLLVAKMGYFADVTSGQRLEDMDISVHCDLQIFEWLMKWVKRDSMSQEMWPNLDPSNVIPILVSASFLQMEPLLLDCLIFCHSHLNEVVKTSANLSCLNDNIISRLAAMFTNLELEVVKDKKERVTPRLWTKLIQSLCEPEPQALRGHYATLSDLFRCNRCSKYLTQCVSPYIYCIPQNMRLNRWGQLINQHSRDQSWNITNYVASLHKEMKSWRKVYWRLWGNCHFLYCATCEMHFPVYQMNWCLYHPDQPQFLGPVTEGRMAGPAGRYPCCGQQAFRYETLPGPMGCQYREHTVQIDTDRDRAILKLAQVAADEGGCLYQMPPANKSPISSGSNTNTASGIDPWWNGMSVTPNRERQGLFPPLNIEGPGERTRSHRRILQRPMSIAIDSSSETESENRKNPILKQFSTSSDGAESDELSSPRPMKSNKHRAPRRKAKVCNGRHWSGDISARSNQDNQREFEERVMKQVIALVDKKTGGDLCVQYQNYYQGGTYVRLESEWRESVKHKHSTVKTKFMK